MSVTRTKYISISGTGSVVIGGKSEFEFDARRHAHISAKMSERLRPSGGQGVTIYPATRYLFGVSALSVQGHSEHDSILSSAKTDKNAHDESMITVECEKPVLLDSEKIRVLCLSSDTGGGHRASAQALEDCFGYLYGVEFKFNTVDLWSTHSPWPFCNMPKGYAAIVGRRFQQAFAEYKPRLIVSVHPLMQHVPLKVLAHMKKLDILHKLSFATVVTDLTRCHATWFHKAVDRCFVATELVARQAMDHGLKRPQITCHGLPIRPAFSSLRGVHKIELRKKLGLDTSAPTVMLIGGGEGMGKIAEIAEALSARLSPSDQLIVICGRNAALVSELARRTWNIKISVKGFVNNMAEYMASCDCVITKAGPGTIAEALTCGLPIILNGCIPCQEEGNIPYVLQNNVGAYSEDPVHMAQIVSAWFGPQKDSLQEMSERARKLGRPEATFDIVRSLADMARS